MPKRLPVWLIAAFLATGCSAPVLRVTPSEDTVATHRLFEMRPLRAAASCVRPSLGDYQFVEFLHLSLEVNRRGEPELTALSVEDTLGQNIAVDLAQPDRPTSLYLGQIGEEEFRRSVSITPECFDAARNLAREWRYAPFELHGRRAIGVTTEKVLVIPAERYRSVRRPFPVIEDISSVRIKLSRMPGLWVCPPLTDGYTIELRGDGYYAIDAPPRRGAPPARLVDGAIPQEAFQTLLDEFRRADFASLEDEYFYGGSDQTIYTLSLETATQTFSVHSYVGELAGMPMPVAGLADSIDELVESDSVVGPNECYRPLVLTALGL